MAHIASLAWSLTAGSSPPHQLLVLWKHRAATVSTR